MKKLGLVLLLLVLLAGCKKKEKEVEPITFTLEGNIYTYVEVLDNGYDLYRNGTQGVEVKVENGVTDIYYVPSEDIYHILIDDSNIVVKKNGEIIISCIRENEVCSGFENPTFKEDLYDIGDVFN